jgi:hypothetical protein
VEKCELGRAALGTKVVVVVGCMRRVMRREADVRCAGLNIEEFRDDMEWLYRPLRTCFVCFRAHGMIFMT